MTKFPFNNKIIKNNFNRLILLLNQFATNVIISETDRSILDVFLFDLSGQSPGFFRNLFGRFLGTVIGVITQFSSKHSTTQLYTPLLGR